MSSNSNDSVTLKCAPWPKIDFAAFGPVETKPLTRIQTLTAALMARNWATIPHVTHHDEADITGLDQIRASLSSISGSKITPLAFMVKAAVSALQAFPTFNASLDETGRGLVLKQYFHIGIAVETPTGLLVPACHSRRGAQVHRRNR
jgi:pyruvate dehydrogenase E2 component (dihydrolipoamide acetyltransferase)